MLPTVVRTRPIAALAALLSLLLAGPQARCGEPLGAGPPGFVQQWFDDFYETAGWPDEASLRAVLEPVPGEDARIEKTHSRERPICRLSGQWRLTPEWKPESALRLSLAQPKGFQIHFWAGRAGVTLRFFPDFLRTWAAYGTTRSGDKPRPEVMALWATDQGRYRRTGTGTVTVYHRDGSLILARGDVRLLTVPLASPPSQVVLDGTAYVRGIAVFQAGSVPEDEWGGGASPGVAGQEIAPAASVAGGTPAPQGTSAPQGTGKPTAARLLKWETRLAQGATLNHLADGGVELSSGEKTAESLAWAAVCRPGLHEYLFEVENPEPASGVFLADQEGKPLARLAFFRDRRTKQAAFGLVGPDHREVERSYDEGRPAPLAGARHWFRIAAGANQAKLFTSGDGVHWSQPDPASIEFGRPATQIGLYCWAGEQARAIRLRRVAVRRLETVESLAPGPLREQVAKAAEEGESGPGGWLGRPANLDEWEKRVAESAPAGAAPALWRRACALQAIGAGPTPWWAQQLLDGLIAEGVAQSRDAAFALRLLDEAGPLVRTADWPAADRWAARYERVGLLMEDQGRPDAFPEVWRRMAISPFWAERDLPPALERPLWYDLVRRMSEGRWQAAAELCRRVRFRARPDLLERQSPPWSGPVEHVVRCVEERASTHKAELAPDRPLSGEFDYAHPLVEQWAKEGYNVMTEFQAALDGQGFREACQVIASAARPATDGLLPDPKDPQHLVSLAGLIAQAMDESAELRRTMRGEFERVGQLRLMQAVESGDSGAVEMLAVQFAGTDAAADAHRWLGDRRMAAGRFAEAAGQYRQGFRSASDAARAGLAARLQLAAAMRGTAGTGGPAAGAAIGGQQLSGKEFAALLQEMAAARATAWREPAEPAAGRGGACPLPGACQVRPFVVAEGGTKKPDHYSASEMDWAGREMAAALAGPQMVIASRSEHLGVDLATGKHVWRHLRHIPSPARPWPLVATPPVCGMDRVFVRRFADGGPELACLDRIGGGLLWTSAGEDYVASDAVLVDQGAWALTVRRAEGQKCTLHLVRFDLATGRASLRAPLVDFRAFLSGAVPCQAASADDRIVATAGGAVVCCDLSGRLCWLRRQAWIAPPGVAFYDSRPWLVQRHEPPVVMDGRVFVTQPGAWNVECLDVQTGRLVWRTTLSELTGLLGASRGTLVAETSEGLVGLDCGSGKVAWRHDARDRLEGRLCGEPGGILYARLLPSGEQARKEPKVALAWVDPADGKTVDERVLDLPPLTKPLLGPMLTDGRRLWVFYGAADDTARREVFEVVLDRHASGG